MSVAPLIRNPFTDFLAITDSHQWYSACHEIEMTLINCMEAYGLYLARTKCEFYAENLFECSSARKRNYRTFLMRVERELPYLTFKRRRKACFVEGPPLDSY